MASNRSFAARQSLSSIPSRSIRVSSLAICGFGGDESSLIGSSFLRPVITSLPSRLLKSICCTIRYVSPSCCTNWPTSRASRWRTGTMPPCVLVGLLLSILKCPKHGRAIKLLCDVTVDFTGCQEIPNGNSPGAFISCYYPTVSEQSITAQWPYLIQGMQ